MLYAHNTKIWNSDSQQWVKLHENVELERITGCHSFFGMLMEGTRASIPERAGSIPASTPLSVFRFLYSFFDELFLFVKILGSWF